MSQNLQILADQEALSLIEKSKRKDQSQKRPRVHQKIQDYFKNMLDGDISPILRLKINRSLCNFSCAHCCEEPYMTRDLKKRTGMPDPRPQMSLDDYRELSRQADEYGIFRFVLTGGEALLDKNLDKLIEALDPMKHLMILDTNGWTFDEEKAKWFAGLGGYKAQISLDSYIESEHDAFRSKKGSYKRVMRALEASKRADLELLISTCIIKDRVFSQEFEDLCHFCKDEDIPLYVTLAKPVGTAREQDTWVCTKKDVDHLKYLEDRYNIFTHMTPSYGQPGRCITVKGINTVNHDGEIIPCPYMDLSIGNVTKEPLSTILERGMMNSWLGPYRDECIIGEHKEFIKFHNDAVHDYLDVSPLLPVPYEYGFGRNKSIVK
ncbi:radical SAM protein [Polynucleobacter paneuropaeus]|nr:radical SAM protein [Polynucleobacter paneuropaeus]